jgi:LysM domain.
MSDEVKVLNDQEVENVSGGGANGYFYPDGDGIYYRIASKDTLSEIAMRAQVPMAQILRLNPQIKNPDLISAGAVIRIK